MTKRLVVATFGLVWAACSPPPPSGNDAGNPELTCDANPASVTTAQVQTEVFDVSCKSCHFKDSNTDNPADMDMSSASVTQQSVGKNSIYCGQNCPADALKIVHAGNLANSTMWLKLLGGSPTYKGPKGENVGARMPQGAPALDEAKKKLVRDWICSGAKP